MKRYENDVDVPSGHLAPNSHLVSVGLVAVNVFAVYARLEWHDVPRASTVE